jgi:hypothetical protein
MVQLRGSVRDQADQVYCYSVAKSELESTTSYLRRGRYLEKADLSVLRTEFVASHKAWANEPFGTTAATWSADVRAEYELREVDLPLHLITSEINKVRLAAANILTVPKYADRLRRHFQADCDELLAAHPS